jgi:hypothetical protein
MILAYKLREQINGDTLLKNIQQLIQKSIVDQSKEYLLIIKVDSIDYDENSCIPKIEYHDLDQTTS